MDAELALAYDRRDIFDPRLARVADLRRTSGDVAAVEDREHQRVEYALVFSVERAVYEDAVVVTSDKLPRPNSSSHGASRLGFDTWLASGSSGRLPALRCSGLFAAFAAERACGAHRHTTRLDGVLDCSSRLAHTLHHTPNRVASEVTTAHKQQILYSIRACRTATRTSAPVRKPERRAET